MNLSNKKFINIFFLISIIIYTIILGFLKISSLFIFLSGLIYLFFRLNLYRKKIYIYTFIGILISAIFCVFFASPLFLNLSTTLFDLNSSGTLSNSFNSFFKRFVINSNNFFQNFFKFILFIIFNYLWFLILVIIFIKLYKNNIKEKFKSKKTIVIETMTVISISGIIPGIVLDLSCDYYYFLNFQKWVSLVLVISFYYIKKKNIINFSGLKFFKKINYNILKNKAKKAFFSILSILLFLSFSSSIYFSIKSYIPVAKDVHSKITIVNNSELYNFFSILENISNIPPNKKSEMIIYIPKTNYIFWDLEKKHSFAMPFLVPSITGIAMVDGLKDIHKTYKTHGYSMYSDSKSLDGLSENEILKLVKNMGFSELII